MKILFALSLTIGYVTMQAQTHQEIIKKDIAFEKPGVGNTIIVENIFGDITVEGYNGSVVIVEVEKIIKGKTQARLEKGITDIQLGIVDLADTLILYTKGFCHEFGKGKDRNEKTGGWAYQWNCKNDCNMEFDYIMNYKIKVPAQTNVVVTTVNDGDIVGSKISGRVLSQNVNGSIKLDDLVQSADAHTINGDVTVNYTKHPQAECHFYTLNGNINANFPKGLAANVNFKSFNGDFFTNVSKLDNLAVVVDKELTNKGTKYSVSGNHFKAGGGGTRLDFETFNGNVYLKEAQ